MFNLIQALYSRGFREIEKMRRCLVSVIVLTIIGVALLLFIRPAIGPSFYFTLIPWVLSAYYLFSIKRITTMHLTGESFEFLSALSAGLKKSREGGTTETKEATGLFDNEFIRNYLSVIFGIFLVQTSLFLIIPLYVNYSMGGMTTVIIILMLLTIIAIDNFTSFQKMSRFTVKMAVIAYTIGLVIVLVPQVGFYASYIGGDRINIVPQSTAKIANEINQLRAKQREEQNNARLREGLDWQRNNPGQELPSAYKEKVQEVGRVISFENTVKPEPVKEVAVSAPARTSNSSQTISNERLERMARRIRGS